MKHKSLIKKAIKKAGSQAELAKRLGLSQQGVSYLLNQATRVSGETAVAIDRFTGGEVRKEDLRPDIFGSSR
jgi:DNA-binding transcriptional regulator YdaS (Cro superfamily)